MNTIGLFIKRNSPNSVKIGQKVVDAAQVLNINVITAINEGEDISLSGCHEYVKAEDVQKSADFVLVIGGDGTFLAAARALFGKSTPLLGINLGHLGFLSEIDANQDMQAILKELMVGHFPLEKRSYYEVTLMRGDKKRWQEPFLNDVVLQRNADEKMLLLKVSAAGAKVSESRADGLIISTPTGSTAYNLSAGGPILHPQLEGMVLAPICPHKMSLRPIVLPPIDVEVEVLSEIGHISIDGQQTLPLEYGDRLCIKRSTHDLIFVKSRSKDFFSILREKLGWDIDFLQKSVDG